MSKFLFFVLISMLVLSVQAIDLSDRLTLNYANFSYVSSVAVGYDYVYFATTGGITRYHISRGFWDDPLTNLKGLHGMEIHEIEVSRNDESIWARTDLGIFEYTLIFEQWEQIDKIPDNNFNGRHVRPDFDYFPPIGYSYFNTGILVDQNNNNFPLTDVVDDGWTNLWIGTWGLGVFQADNTSHHMKPLNYGLLQDNITSIYNDDGHLWMGGIDNGVDRCGLSVFDWAENNFSYVEIEPGQGYGLMGVNDIKADDKEVFVATDNGLLVIDRETNFIKNQLYQSSGLPANKVLSVLPIGDTILVGSEYGLGILNINSDSTEITGTSILPSLLIYSLMKVDEEVWIGSSNGVYRMNLKNGRIGQLTAYEIGYGKILDMELGPEKIWLAMENDLISIDLSTADIETYPEVNRYGGARAIAVEDTLLAAATNNGLLLFFNGKKPHHYLYTVNDGLISNEINDLVFDGEYIWLATDKGLTRFWYKSPSLYY